MKHLRTFVLPLACFATCWLLTAWLGGLFLPQPAAEDRNAPDFPSSARPNRPVVSASETRLRSLRHDFERLPTVQWAERWQTFAQDSTPEEWEILRKDPSEILAALADEQGTWPGTATEPKGPAGFAALAERDPETAWQHFRERDPNAILRTLAANNPEQTLQRLLSVPELVPENHYGELDRAALWRTPKARRSVPGRATIPPPPCKPSPRCIGTSRSRPPTAWHSPGPAKTARPPCASCWISIKAAGWISPTATSAWTSSCAPR